MFSSNLLSVTQLGQNGYLTIAFNDQLWIYPPDCHPLIQETSKSSATLQATQSNGMYKVTLQACNKPQSVDRKDDEGIRSIPYVGLDSLMRYARWSPISQGRLSLPLLLAKETALLVWMTLCIYRYIYQLM